MTKQIYYLFIITLLFSFSCQKKNSDINIYDGLAGQLVLELDSLTPSFMHHYQIIKEGDKKLLYALSTLKNRFTVYELNSGEFVKSIVYESTEKAPLNFGEYTSGFYYHTQDSIFFLSSTYRVFLGNGNGDFIEIFNFPKNYPENNSFWPIAIPNSKPLFYQDSILSLSGVNENNRSIFEEGFRTDFNLILSKNNNVVSYVETEFPKGNYNVGDYYLPLRKKPARAFSKSSNLVYYSYTNSDTLYEKDLVSGELTSIYAKIDKMEPFIHIKEVKEYREIVSSLIGQREYNAKQGRYSTVAVNEKKDIIIRVAYLGIKDFNIDLYTDGFYKKLNYGITFIDRKNHRQLKTIYLQNIDDTSILFDDDYFYVYCFDSQKEEDKLVFDKYAYPEFD